LKLLLHRLQDLLRHAAGVDVHRRNFWGGGRGRCGSGGGGGRCGRLGGARLVALFNQARDDAASGVMLVEGVGELLASLGRVRGAGRGVIAEEREYGVMMTMSGGGGGT
jgi:hypothetical protein